jgi:hypothetical protein
MTAPLRGTQSLVGQMGWVFSRPWLTAIEVGWRWFFGIPFLVVCQIEVQHFLAALPLESTGLTAIDAENPWVAVVQLAHAWALYRPRVYGVVVWLAPVAGLAWVIVSGLGRNVVLRKIEPTLASRSSFRPLQMMVLQAAWLALLGATFWAWFHSMEWVAATHITPSAEPDLVGYACWAIFLALGFFTAWALVSWTLSVAPLVMLLEGCNPAQALVRSLQLGKGFTGRLIEINLVMGIVNLALIVLAMVLSAAPLPFSDQLGSDALHWIDALAVVFYLVASDYFQIVRLKGFIEFWKMFRGNWVCASEARQASRST